MDFSNSTCLSLQRSWFTLAYCNSSLGTKLRFTPGCVPHANRCPLLRYRTKAHHRNYPQLLVCYHRSYFLEVDKTTGAGCSHRVRLLSSYVLWGCPATKMGSCVGIRCGSWTRLSIMMVHPFGNFRKSRKSNLRTPRVSLGNCRSSHSTVDLRSYSKEHQDLQMSPQSWRPI